MKDQDLRTETAARKRARKKAQRRAGVPTFTFQHPGFAAYLNACKREDHVRARRWAREEREASRHRVTPVSKPKKSVIVTPRLLGAVLLLAAAGAPNGDDLFGRPLPDFKR